MPPNTRLQTLLDRCPLGEEDCYNIAVIFQSLSVSRQQYILDNWDIYIVEMVMLRKEQDAKDRDILERVIELADTINDAKNLQEVEKEIEKYRKSRETRLELESVHTYHEASKLNLIRSIAQIPDEESHTKSGS